MNFSKAAMKHIFFTTLFAATPVTVLANKEKTPAPREIVFHTESVDGKTHWMPQKIDGTAGEKVTLVFRHELATGPEFHGVSIPEFGINAKVLRLEKNNKNEQRFDVTLPDTKESKDISVKCQFHPAHQPALLTINPAK